MKLYIENIRFTTLLISNLYEFTNLAVQIIIISINSGLTVQCHGKSQEIIPNYQVKSVHDTISL